MRKVVLGQSIVKHLPYTQKAIELIAYEMWRKRDPNLNISSKDQEINDWLMAESFVLTKALPLNVIGNLCGVKRGMRLANGGPLCRALEIFFDTILPYTNDYGNQGRPFALYDIAEYFNSVGVMSASGLEATRSHVSNCIRKSVKQTGPAYSKPGYAGCNWHSFK